MLWISWFSCISFTLQFCSCDWTSSARKIRKFNKPLSQHVSLAYIITHWEVLYRLTAASRFWKLSRNFNESICFWSLSCIGHKLLLPPSSLLCQMRYVSHKVLFSSCIMITVAAVIFFLKGSCFELFAWLYKLLDCEHAVGGGKWESCGTQEVVPWHWTFIQASQLWKCASVLEGTSIYVLSPSRHPFVFLVRWQLWFLVICAWNMCRGLCEIQ